MADGTSSIGGIDASIPLQAGRGVPQVNPLQQIGEFANASNALNQLKLFPGVQQLQQQAIQRGGVSNAQLINQAVNQGLTPLLAMPQGTITHKAALDALAGLEARGLPTHGIIQDVFMRTPTGDGPQFDQMMRSHLTSQAMASPESSVGAVTGTPTTIGTGQSQQPGVIPGPGAPGFGSFQPSGAPVQQYPSRSELLQQVGRPVTPQEAQTLGVPPGTPITETMLTRLTQQGAGGLLGPAAGNAFGPNGGRLAPSPALLNPNRQPEATPQPGFAPVTSNPAAPTVAPNAGGKVVSGMAPGEADTMGAQVAPAQAMAQRVATFQTDMFPLKQAQQALTSAPTGKGSAALHDISSYINTFAPESIQKALAFTTPVMGKDEVAAYDEARKYLTQSQLGVSGAGRSDQGLTTAGAASPSTTISKEAAQVVLKGMIALRRMEQDEGQSWIASGQPVSKLNQFRSDFQKQADPKVYTFDMMTPAQRRDTLASFKDPAKRATFIGSVQRAEQNGVLAPPAQ